MTAPPPPDDASSLPFTPVSRHGDIPAGEGRTFEVGGRLVAVFFDGEAYHAMDDLCPHMGASLGSGPFVDGVVTCPWHAWRFRACDGAWCDTRNCGSRCSRSAAAATQSKSASRRQDDPAHPHTAHTVTDPPGASTFAVATPSTATPRAQAAASCSIGGQVP